MSESLATRGVGSAIEGGEAEGGEGHLVIVTIYGQGALFAEGILGMKMQSVRTTRSSYIVLAVTSQLVGIAGQFRCDRDHNQNVYHYLSD